MVKEDFNPLHTDVEYYCVSLKCLSFNNSFWHHCGKTIVYNNMDLFLGSGLSQVDLCVCFYDGTMPFWLLL